MGYSKIDELAESDPRWDDFRVFVAISNSSSIKRAAAELGITQSSLSKRLSRLELSLGAQLVERSPLGASLTYQGERVLSRVLAAQKELSHATIDARSAEGRVEGDCSLLVSDGVANFWLSKFLALFFDCFPNIELKVVLDHDAGEARNKMYDIRLHYFKPIDQAQIMRPIATLYFVPFASRNYLNKHGQPRSIGEMSSHRIVDQTHYLVGKGGWSSWFNDEQFKRTALFTNQSAFLAKCVREGVGIALMPTYLVLVDEEIVPLDLGISVPAKLFASYRRERVANQPVRATLDFLRSVVFDVRRMPWFGEEFLFPEQDWPAKFAAAMSRAGIDSDQP